MFTSGPKDLLFGTAGGEKMRITSGGNVLIGTTDDGGRVVSYTTTAAQQFKAAGTAPAITFSNTVLSPTIGGVLGVCTAASQFFTGTASSDMVLANQFSVGGLIFGTSNLERMRISVGGNLLVGSPTDDTVNKLQVTGSAYVSARIIANQTVGKNGDSGTIANGVTKSINLNSFGGDLSAGYVVCSSAATSSTFNSVIIVSQIHTSGANTYATVLTQNDSGLSIISLVANNIQIVNNSGGTLTYNCRYINFCDSNTWSGGF
jgi:hypothetical protein